MKELPHGIDELIGHLSAGGTLFLADIAMAMNKAPRTLQTWIYELVCREVLVPIQKNYGIYEMNGTKVHIRTYAKASSSAYVKEKRKCIACGAKFTGFLRVRDADGVELKTPRTVYRTCGECRRGRTTAGDAAL